MMGVLDGFVSVLNNLAAVLGTIGTVTLVAVVLAFVLLSLDMILKFGHRAAVEMFLPFLREAFKTLRSESTKTHPAIRLEMRFEYFFGTITAFCLLVNALHALIPWVNEKSEQVILGSLITSAILFVLMAAVSLTLALRLK